MEQIKFSVVIPLYNKEKHIQRAIESVLAQTCQNFELIIINDGSTDQSLNMIAQYENNPKIKIISQENRGDCAARNRGIQESTSEYIAFLDADDSWDPKFLSEIAALIQQYPNCGIYSTAYQSIISNREIKQHKFAGMSFSSKNQTGIIDNLFFSMANGQDPITASSSCIPKKVFDEVGLFLENRKQLQEDVDMWIRIACKHKVAFSKRIRANYYCDAENRVCLNFYLQGDTHPIEENLWKYISGQLDDDKSKWLKEYLALIYFSNTIRCLAHLKKNRARKLSKKVITNKYTLKFKNFVAYWASFLPDFMLKFFLKIVLPRHCKKMGELGENLN